MAKYVITELVARYHQVEVDDEINIEEVINSADSLKHRYDSGCDAIEAVLRQYEDKYGFEYSVYEDECGTSVESISVAEEDY